MRSLLPLTAALALLGVAPLAAAAPAGSPAVLAVDAAADRQAIHPEIYGVTFAATADLEALNAPLNREGGNAAARYNWELDASNRGQDWFFESVAEGDSERPPDAEPGEAVPGAYIDALIGASRAARANVMITVPITGWVANLGPRRHALWSYSIAKYGPQTAHDPTKRLDAGNGIRAADRRPITNNDPTDANLRVTPDFQRRWVEHLIRKWGRAADGGVRYYLMDNEPAIWHEAHRDVVPQGVTAATVRDAIIAYATMIRSADPGAKIVGPEEWGWSAFAYSGRDKQWGEAHRYRGPFPDRTANGMDYFPWLLKELNAREQATGVRLLDLVTLHWYPQGGEFTQDVSPKIQRLRNRSTRALWDPAYRDTSWVNDTPRLIPRMRELVAEYYPGRAIGLTEYDWGADRHINGATAEADILGILGREGIDLAARWTLPPAGSPVYKAIQMYRNYDGARSTFGDMRVRLTNSADADHIAAFAAERTCDGALTVMIVAKDLEGTAPIELRLAGFAPGAKAQVWQLTAANTITRLEDLAISAATGRPAARLTVPAPSITLLVVPKAGRE